MSVISGKVQLINIRMKNWYFTNDKYG